MIDLTHRGVFMPGIPVGLGVRPQAMRLEMMDGSEPGLVVPRSVKAGEVFRRAARLSRTMGMEYLYHRAFIGETVSVIYLPVYLRRGRVYDGVTNEVLVEDASRCAIAGKDGIGGDEGPGYRLLPTLCPGCGWDLEGEKDAVAQRCGNCGGTWEASRGGFSRLEAQAALSSISDPFYLPFWRIRAEASNLPLESFADFIRFTRQPLVVREGWDSLQADFWIPAVKLRPGIFLRLSATLMLAQPRIMLGPVPKEARAAGVNLPRREASQALKSVLVTVMIKSEDLVPMLPRVKFRLLKAALVYMPFRESGYDLVEEHTGTAVPRAAAGGLRSAIVP